MKAIMNYCKEACIPVKNNDYLPHLLRPRSALIIIALSLILAATLLLGKFNLQRSHQGAAVYSSVVVDLTNKDRVAEGLPPLTLSPQLEAAARLKVNDMVKNSYFAHTSPDGLTPWHWFEEAGYSFLFAGENLAIDFKDSQKLEDAWLRSPTHRANILSPRFSEMGVATAEGIYQGHKTTFVVEMFGTPFSDETYAKAASILNRGTKAITVPPIKGASLSQSPETLESDASHIAVKNNTIPDDFLNINFSQLLNGAKNQSQKYSTWMDRAFLSLKPIQLIYSILFLLIFIPVLLTIIHRRSLIPTMYGLMTLTVITLLLYFTTFLL